MSNVESRSIINAPIRRSFDVIQNQARDLAEQVDANETTEATHHRKSAWGVVGVGSFPLASTIMAGGASRNPLSNPLTVTFVKDRWYEVRCTIRAITPTGDTDPALLEPDDVVGMYALCNIGGADRGGAGQHVQVVATTQGAQFIWALRCPTDIPVGAQTVTILVTNVRAAVAVQIYTDAGSQFIVQDIGSTLP
jgi:hypothetical protein